MRASDEESGDYVAFNLTEVTDPETGKTACAVPSANIIRAGVRAGE
jgi:hypothetical protein